MTIIMNNGCPSEQASVNVCEYIKQCETVNNIITKNNSLTYQITNIKEKIKNIKNEINKQKNVINGLDTISKNQNIPIQELIDNINELINKICYINQWINYTKGRVIVDATYLNFDEWVSKYYINHSPLDEDFKKGDLYINVNQAVEATNTVYVNIREHGSDKLYSANDWQEMYDYTKTSVLSILGIDPVEVTHPYSHEWTININPEKLQLFIENLKHLDLSHTDVSLGEIYFDPDFKENVSIENNLGVDNTITTSDLVVENDAEFSYVHIKHACIENIECDIQTRDLSIKGKGDVTGDVIVNEETKAHTLNVGTQFNMGTGDSLYIGDERFSDRLTRTVEEKNICLCCECPDPHHTPTCAELCPGDDCPPWCGCGTCQSVTECEWCYALHRLDCTKRVIPTKYTANNPESQEYAEWMSKNGIAEFNSLTNLMWNKTGPTSVPPNSFDWRTLSGGTLC